jgi:saccharopine dehydrogenase-like NADP-dependent oxidoreductase
LFYGDDRKKVLLLGSGLVAKPVVDYFTGKEGYSITIGTVSPHLPAMPMQFYSAFVFCESVVEDLTIFGGPGIATDNQREGRMLATHARSSTVSLDVKDARGLSDLIGGHDVVIRYAPRFFIPILFKSWNALSVCVCVFSLTVLEFLFSLVPAPLHPAVAEICIAKGKNLVTASYVSPEMKLLHQR